MSDVSPEERARIEQRIRATARKRVGRKLGFYWHVAVFVMANGAMLAINLTHSPEYHWFVWPLAAWGTALVLHGLATFQGAGVSAAMIEAEVQRELVRRGLG